MVGHVFFPRDYTVIVIWKKVSWNCLIEKVQAQVMMLQKIIDDAAWCGKNTLCLDGLIVRVSRFEFL